MINLPDEIKKKKFTLSVPMIIFLATIIVYCTFLWIKIGSIDNKLDTEVYNRDKERDSIEEAQMDFRDSVHMANVRYNDSLESVYKKKYTSSNDTLIKPAEVK